MKWYLSIPQLKLYNLHNLRNSYCIDPCFHKRSISKHVVIQMIIYQSFFVSTSYIVICYSHVSHP